MTVLSSPKRAIDGPADVRIQEDLLDQFESGAMQKLLPDIPIAHVDNIVEDTLQGTIRVSMCTGQSTVALYGAT